MQKLEESKKNSLIYISILFVTAYYLLPVIKAGYIGDDLYNSQIKGRLFYDNQNIFEYYFIEAKSWYWNNGRLFPITLCMYFLFYFIENVMVVKTFYVFLILLNLFMFSKIIFHFTNSKRITILFYLLILSSIQLRLWHDPILSFHGLMQILLFVLTNLCILFYKISKI